MAVYTNLSFEEMQQLLSKGYGYTVFQAKPIAAGIENSIYQVECVEQKVVQGAICEHGARHCYAFVIFEGLGRPLVEAYCEQLDHLSALLKSLPHLQVPSGVKRLLPSQEQIYTVDVTAQTAAKHTSSKPGLLQPWIPGAHVVPTQALCFQLGQFLGVLNSIQPEMTTSARAILIPNHQHLRRIAAVKAQLNHYDSSMQRQFAKYEQQLAGVTQAHKKLSQGLVHGDLFVDNALSEMDHLTGIIDFFNASWSPKLLDLAICLMDWCFDGEAFIVDRVQALIQGFRENCALVQPFDLGFWPDLVRLAGFRFWCTRQEYYIACRQRQVTPVVNRDPAYCAAFIRQVSKQQQLLQSAWS